MTSLAILASRPEVGSSSMSRRGAVSISIAI